LSQSVQQTKIFTRHFYNPKVKLTKELLAAEKKLARLLSDRNDHPYAVRAVNVDDVMDRNSHFNNPDGSAPTRKILKTYYEVQRSIEEKTYLEHELSTVTCLLLDSCQKLQAMQSQTSEYGDGYRQGLSSEN
jgi:hypothetical protein